MRIRAGSAGKGHDIDHSAPIVLAHSWHEEGIIKDLFVSDLTCFEIYVRK